MKNNFFLLVMLAIVLLPGLTFSSCTTSPGAYYLVGETNVATGNFPQKTMGLISGPKYTVAGTVYLQKNWVGILGFSTSAIGSIPPFDFYAWQTGGANYIDLLKEARKLYGEDIDAVVDINVDYSGSQYLLIVAHRKIIVTGIAIKYSRDEVGSYSKETIVDRRNIDSERFE